MESWVQSWRPRTNAFLWFFHFICLKCCACHVKVMPGHTKCCTCRANHLSKPEDLMLQNATPLRKSAPWPRNISDEHVFCTTPATRNASFQILFTCPTPAIVFVNITKPSRFAHFWQGCTIPCACHAKRHLNLQKWSEHVVFLPFRLGNVLRATTAYTFFDMSTSKSGPSMVCFVHFDLDMFFTPQRRALFDITTSKSGPTLRCFVHFDFEMCFAPQWRVLFPHLNFQKWSENGVFCTFWLGNVLRATTACNLSISHLASWLRTRRFSEPTFRPSGATNHWKKHSVSRLSYLFARLDLLSSEIFSILIFFLLSSSLLWLFPSLLFICPYCRNFDF